MCSDTGRGLLLSHYKVMCTAQAFYVGLLMCVRETDGGCLSVFTVVVSDGGISGDFGLFCFN